jgi:hypothetical protein
MQIKCAKLYEEEMRLLTQPDQRGDRIRIPGCCGCCGLMSALWFWVYRRSVCCLASPHSGYESKKKTIQKLTAKLEAVESEGLQTTNHAIVVFNYERHAKNMLRDHERIARTLRGTTTPSSVRTFHRITGARALPRPRAAGCKPLSCTRRVPVGGSSSARSALESKCCAARQHCISADVNRRSLQAACSRAPRAWTSSRRAASAASAL